MKETIRIEGMSCDGCVGSVRRALERLPLAKVEVEIGSATIEYDESVVDHDAIVGAIEDAGYDVRAAA